MTFHRFGQHLLDIKINKNNAQLLTLCNNYLTVCHVVTRVLCLVASVINIPILMSLAGPDDIQSAIGEKSVNTSSLALPRVVLCNFQIRHQVRSYNNLIGIIMMDYILSSSGLQCYMESSAVLA